MMRVVFKDIASSEMTLKLANSRFKPIFKQFPELHPHDVLLLVSLENSPLVGQFDQFVVKLYCQSEIYGHIRVEKWNQNLYVAISELADHFQEKLLRRRSNLEDMMDPSESSPSPHQKRPAS
jgi:hypothetical protein